MRAIWPQTMGELRQRLARGANPDFVSRGFLWIFSWFGGPEARAMWKSLPEARKHFARLIGIIDAMTPTERATPELISFARQYRIARGSGVRPSEVRGLLQTYYELKQRANNT